MTDASSGVLHGHLGSQLIELRGDLGEPQLGRSLVQVTPGNIDQRGEKTDRDVVRIGHRASRRGADVDLVFKTAQTPRSAAKRATAARMIIECTHGSYAA